MKAPPDWVLSELANWRAADLDRQRVVVERRRAGRIVVGGRSYIDFASNDYLGLASHEAVLAAAHNALRATSFGAAASPMVTGHDAERELLERELADWLDAEAALVFGSGFVGNASAIAALVGPADTVFCEKRNHASLVDGCRLSGAKLRVYRSARLDELDRRLAQAAGRRLIVTDAIFSMDGDAAPLADLCDIADRHDAILYVDEAHALGVLGPRGGGLTDQLGLTRRVALRLGTLGKALGSVGGFIVGAQPWIDWLAQKAHGYMYATSLPTVCAAASRAALLVLRGEPERAHNAMAMADGLRAGLREQGWSTPNGAGLIVPLPMGEARRALELASTLRQSGAWCAAIRPPTVPVGQSRLRLTVSASHRAEDIALLLSALRQFRRPGTA